MATIDHLGVGPSKQYAEAQQQKDFQLLSDATNVGLRVSTLTTNPYQALGVDLFFKAGQHSPIRFPISKQNLDSGNPWVPQLGLNPGLITATQERVLILSKLKDEEPDPILKENLSKLTAMHEDLLNYLKICLLILNRRIQFQKG